jgi:UDP-3-O-[3-hydroxymyristoyl] glucosamine N-acyltransferase
MATTDGQPPDPGGVRSTEIASHLSCSHSGDSTTVTGFDSLDGAGSGDLAYSVYEDGDPVRASAASVVLCPPTVDELPGRTQLFHDDPKAAFVSVVESFFLAEEEGTEIHPTAVVADGATLGRNCRIGPHVAIGDGVTIGDDCVLASGCRLGEPGFGFVRDEDERLRRQPHVGTVRIGDGVEIGANCTIDRAVFDETVVGSGSKLSAGVHLAHQARIGRDTTVAFRAGLAGGATVGDRATVHPQASVATDVSVGDDAEVAMDATVLEDVPAGATVAGTPARVI